MRKHIVMAAFVAAFAFIAGYGVYTSQQEKVMSDLAMANVEALANREASVRDCKYDPVETCILMHPTNPALDQERPNARW